MSDLHWLEDRHWLESTRADGTLSEVTQAPVIFEHLIGIEQTHPHSREWQVRCTCGWTLPFKETREAREAIKAHITQE